jgi:hypothetical protein
MLTDKQERLIAAALRDAEQHDLALGGNAALAVHGLPGFTAKRADLVTTRETPRATAKAAKAVEAQLRRDGYEPERTDTSAERGRLTVPGPRMLAEWTVPVGGKHDHPPIGEITKYNCGKCFERLYIEMSSEPRSHDPVQTSIGPVVHPEDAAGSRVRDLAARGQIRDYADTARLLDRWSPGQLTGFALRQDPELDPRELDRAVAHLGDLPDVALTGLDVVRPEQVPWLRERFENWDRDPRDAVRPEPGQQRERPDPAREARQIPQAPERQAWQQADPSQLAQREAQREEPLLER